MDWTKIGVAAPGFRPTAVAAAVPIRPTPIAAPAAAKPTCRFPPIATSASGDNVVIVPLLSLSTDLRFTYLSGRRWFLLVLANQQCEHCCQQHKHQCLDQSD